MPRCFPSARWKAEGISGRKQEQTRKQNKSSLHCGCSHHWPHLVNLSQNDLTRPSLPGGGGHWSLNRQPGLLSSLTGSHTHPHCGQLLFRVSSEQGRVRMGGTRGPAVVQRWQDCAGLALPRSFSQELQGVKRPLIPTPTPQALAI